jgi:hypothetical protein
VSSSENENKEASLEEDENVGMYLAEKDAGLSCDNDLKRWVFKER